MFIANLVRDFTNEQADQDLKSSETAQENPSSDTESSSDSSSMAESAKANGAAVVMNGTGKAHNNTAPQDPALVPHILHHLQSLLHDISQQTNNNNNNNNNNTQITTTNEANDFCRNFSEQVKGCLWEAEDKAFRAVAEASRFPLPTVEKPREVQLKGRQLLLVHIQRLVSQPPQQQQSQQSQSQQQQSQQQQSQQPQQQQTESQQQSQSQLQSQSQSPQQQSQSQLQSQQSQSQLLQARVQELENVVSNLSQSHLQQISRLVEQAEKDHEAHEQEVEILKTNYSKLENELQTTRQQLETLRQRNFSAAQSGNFPSTVTANALQEEISQLRFQLAEKSVQLENEMQMVDSLAGLLREYQTAQQGVVTELHEQLNSQLEQTVIVPEQANDVQALRQATELVVEKDREILSLQNRCEQLQNELQHNTQTLTQTLNKIQNNNRKFVDKDVISSLFISFLAAKTNLGEKQKMEILAVIASLLEWSEAVKMEVGLGGQSRWGRWLWGEQGVPQNSAVKNISDMWISFLLQAAEDGEHSGTGGHVSPPSEDSVDSFEEASTTSVSNN